MPGEPRQRCVVCARTIYTGTLCEDCATALDAVIESDMPRRPIPTFTDLDGDDYSRLPPRASTPHRLGLWVELCTDSRDDD